MPYESLTPSTVTKDPESCAKMLSGDWQPLKRRNIEKDSGANKFKIQT
jgi:hypothetical protein